jgi:AraC-like DNA-binding protein
VTGSLQIRKITRGFQNKDTPFIEYSKSSFTIKKITMPPPSHNQEIIFILTRKILPWWEQSGLARLVVSANTLNEFKAQPIPQAIQVSVKKRRGRKIAVRGPRTFNKTSYSIAVWPEDGQEVVRYPCLACVLRGQADFHIADYMVHCPQGHFVLFRENIPQPVAKPHFEEENCSNRYCEVLWLMAQPGTANRVSSWLCFSEGEKHWTQMLVDYCLVERAEKITFFNTFFREAIQQTPESRKLAEASLHAFLLLFVRELREGRFSSPPVSDANPQRAPHDLVNPIEMAKQHISYYLHENLTIQSVADAVYMSRSNFVRHFQTETGQTFNQYLTAQRLEEACRLLNEGTRSVTMISRLVGFSPNQLRHLFIKNYGVSPSQFAVSRKKKRNR